MRGDPPKGEESFSPHEQGFRSAQELTSHIAARGSFFTAVAGYPEPHPDSRSEADDFRYLKSKVDAGAELVITQLFLDESMYFSFCEKAVDAGIRVPIVPGIMPIANKKQLERFTAMCGASIPERTRSELESLNSNAEVREYGIHEAIRLSSRLLDKGAPGIHLYTLNKARQAVPILKELKSRGYFPAQSQPARNKEKNSESASL